MHKLLLFLFLFSLTNSFAQKWVDSIELARSYYKKKDYGKAISIYERNPNKKKKQKDLDAEIAQSYYRNREFDKSKSHYNEALKKAKSPKNKSKLHHNIGNSKFKKKDYNGAIESYKNALRLNPNDEETRYNLSEAIRRKNQKKQNIPPPKPPKKNNDKNPNKDKNQPSNNDQNSSPKKLPNKKAEKMLDELSKQESRTKRKMQGNTKSKSSNNSTKDW